MKVGLRINTATHAALVRYQAQLQLQQKVSKSERFARIGLDEALLAAIGDSEKVRGFDVR